MAKCNRELLSRYKDGEITPQEHRQVEAHLSSCPDCQATLTAYEQTGRSISGLCRPRAPTGLRGEVFARVAQQRRRSSGGSYLGTLLSGLALAGTAVFAIVVLSDFLGNMVNRQAATVASAVFPPPDAADVSPASAVEVRFNKPMDTRSVADSVAITPSVTTDLGWDGDKLVVKAVQGFAANTSYTLTIDSRARDLQGVPLKDKVVLHFSTGALATIAEIVTSTLNIASGLAVITPTATLVAYTASPTTTLVAYAPTPTAALVASTAAPTATLVAFTPTPTATLVAYATSPTATLVALTPTPISAQKPTITPTAAIPTPTPFVTSTVRIAYVYDPSVGASYSGDWPIHLRNRGYSVTSIDVTSELGFDLNGYNVIVVGWLSGRELAANVARIQDIKTPVLNGYARLVESLGQGKVYDQGNSGRTVYGKVIKIEADGGALTAGYSGEVTVAEETLYRVPIISNGPALATVTDEQQGVKNAPVWSLTGNQVYFGFWYSKDGGNHNEAYWTFFDRSVDYLLGRISR